MGLSLLLLFAFAATAHSDVESAASGSSFATASSDSPATAAVAEHDREPTLTSSETSALVGAAICLLGVLCGLTLMITLLRAARRPRLSALPTRGPSAMSRPATSAVAPRVTALSLTRLGLSRT